MLKNKSLVRSERREHFLYLDGKSDTVSRGGWLSRIGVCDELFTRIVGIVSIHRSIKRTESPPDKDQIPLYELNRPPNLFCNFLIGGSGVQSLRQFVRDTPYATDNFRDMYRSTQRSCLVRNGSLNETPNPKLGIGREFCSLPFLVLLDCAEKTEISLLHKVRES